MLSNKPAAHRPRGTVGQRGKSRCPDRATMVPLSKKCKLDIKRKHLTAVIPEALSSDAFKVRMQLQIDDTLYPEVYLCTIKKHVNNKTNCVSYRLQGTGIYTNLRGKYMRGFEYRAEEDVVVLVASETDSSDLQYVDTKRSSEDSNAGHDTYEHALPLTEKELLGIKNEPEDDSPCAFSSDDAEGQPSDGGLSQQYMHSLSGAKRGREEQVHEEAADGVSAYHYEQHQYFNDGEIQPARRSFTSPQYQQHPEHFMRHRGHPHPHTYHQSPAPLPERYNIQGLPAMPLMHTRSAPIPGSHLHYTNPSGLQRLPSAGYHNPLRAGVASTADDMNLPCSTQYGRLNNTYEPYDLAPTSSPLSSALNDVTNGSLPHSSGSVPATHMEWGASGGLAEAWHDAAVYGDYGQPHYLHQQGFSMASIQGLQHGLHEHAVNTAYDYDYLPQQHSYNYQGHPSSMHAPVVAHF